MQPEGNPYLHKSDKELQFAKDKVGKGCHKIYHQPGYMNVTGDGPYDFTCDNSHNCPQCAAHYKQITTVIMGRNALAAEQRRLARYHEREEEIKNKLFSRCKQCQTGSLCKECVARIQQRVLILEKGCGAQWIEEFGGMAAGPATVTCRDNSFSCAQCSEERYFIEAVRAKHFPQITLEHLPQILNMYWSPAGEAAWYLR